MKILEIKQVFEAPKGFEIVYQPDKKDECRFPLMLLAVCNVQDDQVEKGYTTDDILPVDMSDGYFSVVENMDYEIQEIKNGS